VAVKAPTETKAPWPKLSTSIRPNTSVRPLAMMKIIMPMASPAMVSVTQVGKAADERQRQQGEDRQHQQRRRVQPQPRQFGIRAGGRDGGRRH
jgi:hypothetical protein